MPPLADDQYHFGSAAHSPRHTIFPDFLYTQNNYMQFTWEIEEDWKIPFLDFPISCD